jgi:hypothetical protein
MKTKMMKPAPRFFTVISLERIYSGPIARLACGCCYALSPKDKIQPGDRLMCRNKEHR